MNFYVSFTIYGKNGFSKISTFSATFFRNFLWCICSFSAGKAFLSLVFMFSFCYFYSAQIISVNPRSNIFGLNPGFKTLNAASTLDGRIFKRSFVNCNLLALPWLNKGYNIYVFVLRTPFLKFYIGHWRDISVQNLIASVTYKTSSFGWYF